MLINGLAGWGLADLAESGSLAGLAGLAIYLCLYRSVTLFACQFVSLV